MFTPARAILTRLCRLSIYNNKSYPRLIAPASAAINNVRFKYQNTNNRRGGNRKSTGSGNNRTTNDTDNGVNDTGDLMDNDDAENNLLDDK